jgi:hypothetical protein
VVGVFGKSFSERINLLQPHLIREVVPLPLQGLIGPVADLPDSLRMEETLTARNGRHSDAEVEGTICRILAPFSAEALVMIETRPVIGGTFANLH